MSEAWRRCSVCKEDIGFDEPYLKCSVSTCNKSGRESVFCSVGCWDAHVPVMNHKEASYKEARSPGEKEAMEEQTNANEAQPARPASRQTEGTLSGDAPKEVLIVVSKLKDYIQKRGRMNTSGAVPEVLSNYIRKACDAAIERAAADGRKTVMDRDFIE
jgi:hypothetical protein